jgi:hypothetical protein
MRERRFIAKPCLSWCREGILFERRGQTSISLGMPVLVKFADQESMWACRKTRRAKNLNPATVVVSLEEVNGTREFSGRAEPSLRLGDA